MAPKTKPRETAPAPKSAGFEDAARKTPMGVEPDNAKSTDTAPKKGAAKK